MWTDRAVRGFQSKDKRYRVSDDLGQRGAGKLVLDIQPNGIKTFFYQYYRHEEGRSKRVLIQIAPYKRTGAVSGVTLSEARNKALELSKIAFDGDVKKHLQEERREKERANKRQSIAEITLLETLESYLAHKDLKPGTAYDYERALKATFTDYLDKPITEIDRERILELYRQNTKRSVARANNAMRVFRAIYNYQRAISRMNDGTL